MNKMQMTSKVTTTLKKQKKDMGKTSVSVVFNRKKTIEKKGEAAIEFFIYLSRKQTRYITYQSCTEKAWRTIQRSAIKEGDAIASVRMDFMRW